jgi:hypothetical protein
MFTRDVCAYVVVKMLKQKDLGAVSADEAGSNCRWKKACLLSL